MKIVSVNVGQPKEVEWGGKSVLTAIFKEPTDKRLLVREMNIDGDAQADLEVHGGQDKAVYAYPSEHYGYWQHVLEKELTWGAFGENLTTEGLLENEIRIGDHLRFGSSVLMAIQPRFPCYKLGIRFNDAMMTKRFMLERRNGIYFRVMKEGFVSRGDAIELVQRSEFDVTIQDVIDNYLSQDKDMGKIQQIIGIPFFPEGFKEAFARFLT